MAINLSKNSVTQGLHTALGALFITFPVCWGWHHAQAWGTGIGLTFALVKEFWFDIHFETPETSGGWSGGLRDFSFYVVGIVLTNILVIL